MAQPHTSLKGPAVKKKLKATTSKKTAKPKIHVPPQFECKKCKIAFKQEKYLKAHNQAKHGNVLLSFKCPQCNKKFSTKYLLKHHCQNEHQQILTEEEWKTCTKENANTRNSKYWPSHKNMRIFLIFQRMNFLFNLY